MVKNEFNDLFSGIDVLAKERAIMNEHEKYSLTFHGVAQAQSYQEKLHHRHGEIECCESPVLL